MRISIHSKMIASFLLVVIITGVVSMLVGLRLTGDVIIRQAQEKVRMDLNSARVIYLDNLEKVEEVIPLPSMRFFLRGNLITKDLGSLREVLAIIRNQEGLDILTLTDAVGR